MLMNNEELEPFDIHPLDVCLLLLYRLLLVHLDFKVSFINVYDSVFGYIS